MRRASIVLVLFLLASPLLAESALIDIVHYRAAVRFDLAQRSITGDATLTVRNAALAGLAEIPLDLVTMTVTSVEVGGEVATFRYDNRVLTVVLPSTLAEGDTTEIRILYSGSPGNEGGSFPWGGCHWGEVTYFMGVGFTDPLYFSRAFHAETGYSPQAYRRRVGSKEW